MASIWKKVQEKYVISFRNQDSFFETGKFNMSLFELLSISFLLLMVPFILSFLAFKYTSLGAFLNPVKEEKGKIIALNQLTDSLENQVRLNDQYVNNIQRILAGEEIQEVENQQIDSLEIAKINISDPSEAELALRDKINQRDLTRSDESSDEPTYFFFSLPLTGVVSSEFDPKEKHYGIDVVSPKNTVIQAVADGKVLYSAWNVDDGYTMIMAHDDGFTSIYKHAEQLLKNTNDIIEIGEAIAVVGDSGESSTGYHLHFELWKDGTPVDPSRYINFSS